jgi:tetratricopeptide (TPR) repeat protein
LDEAEHLFRLSQFDKAIKNLGNWIAKHGTENEEIFHLLADSWFLKGEEPLFSNEAKRCYTEQLKASEQGLSVCPSSKLLRKDRGLALSNLGRFSEAENQFNLLLSENDHPTYHYNLAAVNAKMGNKMKALAELERAIQMAAYYQELARVDHDFDAIWKDAMFQALIFQSAVYR